MSENLAARLRASAHETIRDAQRFIQWYEQAEHVSDWDKTRAAQASEIIVLADVEGLLEDIGQ